MGVDNQNSLAINIERTLQREVLFICLTVDHAKCWPRRYLTILGMSGDDGCYGVQAVLGEPRRY